MAAAVGILHFYSIADIFQMQEKKVQLESQIWFEYSECAKWWKLESRATGKFRRKKSRLLLFLVFYSCCWSSSRPTLLSNPPFRHFFAVAVASQVCKHSGQYWQFLALHNKKNNDFLHILGPKKLILENFSPFLVIFQFLAPNFHTILNLPALNGAKI